MILVFVKTGSSRSPARLRWVCLCRCGYSAPLPPTHKGRHGWIRWVLQRMDCLIFYAWCVWTHISDLIEVWHRSGASPWILWSWVSKPRDGVEMSSLSPNQLETQTPPQVGCHPSSLIFFCCPQTLLQIFWTRYTICTSAFSSTDSMLTYLYRVSTFFSNVFQISSSLFLKSCLLWLII